LAALIPGGAVNPVPDSQVQPVTVNPTDGIQSIALEKIVPNTLQPRVIFEPEALQELAESVRGHGVLQPVLVRPRLEGGYELIAGERRFRAAQIAGLDRIPALVRDTNDEESLAIALIENVQREDLNAIEAARGYRQLLERFGLTQSELARQVGKAQPTIANALRLLRLPEPVQESISAGKITEEHGKALLSLPDDDSRLKLWQMVLLKGLTVAETRRAALQMSRPETQEPEAPRLPVRDVHWDALEDRLRSALGYKIGLKPSSKGGATLTIELSSTDDIDDILDRLGTQRGH
jgi:ParB family chromosome partitioning protein